MQEKDKLRNGSLLAEEQVAIIVAGMGKNTSLQMSQERERDKIGQLQ